MGTSFGMKAIQSTSLFGANTKLLTTIIVEGVDSGAIVQCPVTITYSGS